MGLHISLICVFFLCAFLYFNCFGVLFTVWMYGIVHRMHILLPFAVIIVIAVQWTMECTWVSPGDLL